MGVKAEFKNTTFDGIIAALLAKKCDAIISGMNDTAERRKQVDFVDYLKVGQSLMVKKGNPEHITIARQPLRQARLGRVRDDEPRLSRRDVEEAAEAGQEGDHDRHLPEGHGRGRRAAQGGRVDAYFGDSPPAAYYAKHDPSLAIGGNPINPIPVGIAIRKDDPLRAATQKAITAMYANGTIKRILAKWEMTQAVRPAQVTAEESGGRPMLAAVDWHIVWERLFHPDHVFLRALWTHRLHRGRRAGRSASLLGLVAALMRMSRLLALRLLSGSTCWSSAGRR